MEEVDKNFRNIQMSKNGIVLLHLLYCVINGRHRQINRLVLTSIYACGGNLSAQLTCIPSLFHSILFTHALSSCHLCNSNIGMFANCQIPIDDGHLMQSQCGKVEVQHNSVG